MTGYKKILSTAGGMIEQLQVPRRSTRRRVTDNKTKKWAERSVWSTVCAIELGLIQPSTITSFARKLKPRGRTSGWRGKRTTSKGSASKSKITESRLTKGHEINPWLPHDQLNRRIKRNEYSQDNLPLFEHRYSLPPAYNFSENLNTPKARNIYYNGGNRIDDKTTVYNPFNCLREWSKKSNFYEHNCGFKNRNGCRYTNDRFSDDDDDDDTDEPQDFVARKCIFTTHEKRSTLRERFKYGDNSRTIRSIKKMPPKRRYFRHKQGDSTNLKRNKQTRSNVKIRDEKTSKTKVPVARGRLHSNVFQDFSKLDICEFDHGIKNQSGANFVYSSSDDSSESGNQGSHVFPKENRYIDARDLKELYREPDKRLKRAKEMTRKRRYYREPLCLQVNKNNRSSIDKLTKNKSNEEDGNVTRIKINRKIVEEKRKRRFSHCDVKNRNERISPRREATTVHVANSTIDYVDSEVDETLLVDPSTDLPGALYESYNQANEIIDLNPQFDINFDINFEDQWMSTTLDDISFKQNEEEFETNIKKNLLQSNCKDYREKVDVKKNGKESSSFSVQPRKRRSADSILNSNSENKENDNVNNINKKIGRITRGSIKNCIENEINETSWAVGTVVWGNCMGWWPGLIIDAEDVGMCCSEGKSWIYWIGEYRISHLRDKTQIQYFSAGLRTRLIETLKVKTPKDANYAACFATIKLLNDQILQRGPLTKPYYSWVEKHLVSHENIDQLILHPYPPNVQKRLDELKKVNLEATEKYLSDLNETSEKMTTTKSNGINAQESTMKSSISTDPAYLPLVNQKPGVITWAKIMGHIWWPAMIIDFRDCGMKEPNFGCQWILWYGDYKLSQVNHRFILSFEKGVTRMKEYVLNCKNEVYRSGVVDAAKDFCSMYGYKTDEWTIQDVLKWFSRLDDEEESLTLRRNILPGIPGSGETSQKYPLRIVKGLRKYKGNCTVAAIREHNIKDSRDLKSVILGKSDLNALCLMCLKDCTIEEDNKSLDHPFFKGALCEECSEKYTPTIFAYGDDGKCFFCTVCAGSDTVVICDEHDCPRVYCTACLKYLIAPKTYDDIMLNDPFICFLCEDSPDLMIDGLLKPRTDWKTRVARLFHGNRDSIPNQVEYYKDGKKKLRVLSLFDGISAGLVVLNKLGIQVEAYYASEIDPDAEMVSSAHFGEQIIRLGDVRLITEEKIREIAPIHLLIGGSPCNDLSLVNPVRLGLHDPNGTGILVFEYRRIRNLVEKANEEEHFFWLFENVASMPSNYRLEINEHLGREPDIIDAANYSPQHRPRLYWSNFPIVSYPLSSQDLQDVLTPNCNRHALVKKIRTVTTRVNSLKQGKNSLKPILMNEENDTLWITELEEIFGFPRHYTDVKNLCATKRQKLIGKSWSIQTIAELMRPLCNFFQLCNQETT